MKRVNLGEVLRDRIKAGSIPALKEEVFVKADKMNLPELALERVITGFVKIYGLVATTGHGDQERDYNHSRPLDVHRWSDHCPSSGFLGTIAA